MADYRLYFMDEANHIRRALDLDCDDDAEAIRMVERHRAEHAMELWQGARTVKKFPAEKTT